MKKLSFFALVALMAGCATHNVAPQYVNPTVYQNQDCDALSKQINHVNALIDKTKSQRTGLSASGVGIGIVGGSGGIYPSISFGVGNNSGARQQKQTALAKLYGEHDAIIIAGRQKSCAYAHGAKLYSEQ